MKSNRYYLLLKIARQLTDEQFSPNPKTIDLLKSIVSHANYDSLPNSLKSIKELLVELTDSSDIEQHLFQSTPSKPLYVNAFEYQLHHYLTTALNNFLPWIEYSTSNNQKDHLKAIARDLKHLIHYILNHQLDDIPVVTQYLITNIERALNQITLQEKDVLDPFAQSTFQSQYYAQLTPFKKEFDYNNILALSLLSEVKKFKEANLQDVNNKETKLIKEIAENTFDEDILKEHNVQTFLDLALDKLKSQGLTYDPKIINVIGNGLTKYKSMLKEEEKELLSINIRKDLIKAIIKY